MAEKSRDAQVERLTRWYPIHMNPVRIGVYKIKAWGRGEWYSHWNGRFWGFCEYTPDQAHQYRNGKTGRSLEKWRGLARKP